MRLIIEYLPSSQTGSSTSEYDSTMTLLGHISQYLVTRVESAQTIDAPVLLELFASDVSKTGHLEWTGVIDEGLNKIGE